MPPYAPVVMSARRMAALGLLSCVLTACSGGAGGGVTLPPVTAGVSASASASASSRPTASVPAEATAATTQGAEAFVRFFYGSVERAYRDRDASVVRQLSAADCAACNQVIASVDTLRVKNLTVPGYRITVDDAAAPAVEPRAELANVVVVYSATEYVEQQADGQVIRRQAPVNKSAQDVILRRALDRWVVSAIRGRG